MNRLNVVSSTEDRELDAIRRTLASFVAADGAGELIAALRMHAARGGRVALLDMIGHSCSEGFLLVGDWEIDDSLQTAATFSQLVRPYLEQLGVRTIRLLGCSTAGTDRGRRAMSQIARASRCTVFGTMRYISKRDYGRAGFVSVHALVESDETVFERGHPG